MSNATKRKSGFTTEKPVCMYREMGEDIYLVRIEIETKGYGEAGSRKDWGFYQVVSATSN